MSSGMLMDAVDFRAWFGKSRAVDAGCAPVLVYRGEHGDASPGQVGAHSRRGALSFGSLAAANVYAADPNDPLHDHIAVAPRVVPAFLRIERPLIDTPEDPFLELSVLRQALGSAQCRRIAAKFADAIADTGNWDEHFAPRYSSVAAFLNKASDEDLDELYFYAYLLLDDPEEVELLRQAGFDGAIHGGAGANALEPEYKVFSPEQVLPAISAGWPLRPEPPRETPKLTPDGQQPSTVTRVRQAIAQLVGVGVSELREGLGRFVVTTSQEVVGHPVLARSAGVLRSAGGTSPLQQMLLERQAACDRAIKTIGAIDDCAILRHEGGQRWMMILRDASAPGNWRTQSFDTRGFAGHMTFATQDLAVQAAAQAKFTVRDDGALDRLQDTPEFQRGLFVTDLTRLVNLGEITFEEAKQRVAAYDETTAVLQSMALQSAKAFYAPASGTMYMLADRIAQGAEKSVFLHEVVHKHGRKTLGVHGWNRMVGAVKRWEQAPAGSIERLIHFAAHARAAGAVGLADVDLYEEELFAYAVEEAVSRGVTPRAEAAKGSAENWLADVAATLRGVVMQLTAADPPPLEAQELVDLAYALAQLENPARSQELLRELGPELAGQVRQLAARAGRPVWYSALKAQVDALPARAQTPAHWLRWIAGLKRRGVSQSEIEWSGITNWLAAITGPVSPAQMSAFLSDNGVQVQEVLKGGTHALRRADRLRVELDARGYSISDGNSPLLTRRSDGAVFSEGAGAFTLSVTLSSPDLASPHLDPQIEEMALAFAQAYGETRNEANTRYSDLTLAGGEHYSELLLTLPVRRDVIYTRENVVPRQTGAFATRPDLFWYFEVPGNILQIPKAKYADQDAALQYILADKQPEPPAGKNYKSSHWDELNVVGHVRFNERKDVDGRRVLFIEEIQCDWAADGKRSGFARAAEPADTLLDEYRAWQIQHGLELGGADEHLSDAALSAEQREWLSDYSRRRAQQFLAQEAGVPDAPFVGTTDAWVSLILKRVIRYAVDRGIERVAFITGDQSVQRYGLAKELTSLAWTRTPDGRYNIEGTTGSEPIVRRGLDMAALTRLLGASTAARIEMGEGTYLNDPVTSINGQVRGAFDTPGLMVGGYGMRVFYDTMLPRIARHVVRKLGGAGTRKVRVPFMGGMAEEADRLGMSLDDLMDLAEPTDFAAELVGFDINQAMRDASGNGMPLFSLATYQAVAAFAEVRGDALAEARRQCAQVVSAHLATEGWLRAPNGEPTRLTEAQWVMVRTENFKQWFGDWETGGAAQEVLDPVTGEPRVVFHGTHESFTAFDPALSAHFGFHVGERAQAEVFGREPLQLFASLKRPIRLPDLGTWEFELVARELRAMGLLTPEEYERAWNQPDQADALRAVLLGKGYDGIVYLNRAEGFDGSGLEDDIAQAHSDDEFRAAVPSARDSLILFRPNQLKSATANRGTFDRRADDIRFSRGQLSGGEAARSDGSDNEPPPKGPSGPGGGGQPRDGTSSTEPGPDGLLVGYHGTVGPWQPAEEGVTCFASSLAEALRYAPADEPDAQVFRCLIRLNHPLVVETDLQPAEEWDFRGALHLEQARAGGHDGVITRQSSTGASNFMAFGSHQVVEAVPVSARSGLTPSGDGWLRDSQGNPLVVYHGTPEGGFDEFNAERGVFFTSSAELAAQYTMRRGGWLSPGRAAAVYPAHLRMTNPLEIDALGKRHDNIPVPWAPWKPKVFGNLPAGAVSVQSALDWAREHGHDGLIVRNVVDTVSPDGKRKSDVFAVLRADQIATSLGFGPMRTGIPNDVVNKKNTSFLQDMRSTKESNQPGLTFDLMLRNGVVYLDQIEVEKSLRFRGVASRFLQKLAELADAHGHPIELEVGSGGGEDGGVHDLPRFYGKFGFEWKDGYMRRSPSAGTDISRPNISQTEGPSVGNEPVTQGIRFSLATVSHQARRPWTPVPTTTRAFREWFRRSPLVDDDGEPVVLYHGTTADLTRFGPPENGRTDHGWYGLGVGYFTADRSAASAYAVYRDMDSGLGFDPIRPGSPNAGANVVPVYVALQNPYMWPEGRVAAKNREEAQALTDELVAAGYDGVVVPNKYAGGDAARFFEVVAFRPEQIKSAIGNNAQFDGANPDIRFSLAAVALDTVSPQLDKPPGVGFNQWFGGSKVVNAQGEPLRVYHGTPAAGLTVFDSNRIGANGRAEGAGFYFTTDRKTAEGYGQRGETLEVYLGIKKPLAYDTKPFNQAQVRKLLTEVARAEAEDTSGDWRDGFLSNYVDTYNKSMDTAVREAARAFEGEQTALDQVSGILGSGVDADTVNIGLTRALGYDGYFSKGFSGEEKGGGDIWVAMRSEQVKSALANSGQFDGTNPDIRFSLAHAYRSSAFSTWFGNSKVVDEMGRPRVMYHGTTKAFAVFDGAKARKTYANNVLGHFFTESSDVAAMFAGEQGGSNVMPVLLSIQNPYRMTAAEWATLQDYGTVDEALAFRREKENAGYDGLVSHTGTQFVAFHANQIKSAIGNSGEFDGANPDVRFSRALPREVWGLRSKAVDESGKLLTLFHGTAIRGRTIGTPPGHLPAGAFTQFSKDRLGEVTDSSDAKAGFWFTADEDRARAAASDAMALRGDAHSAYVYRVNLRLENPLVVSSIAGYLPGEVAKIARRARARGRDGIIFLKGEGSGADYLVFEPEQIRMLDLPQPGMQGPSSERVPSEADSASAENADSPGLSLVRNSLAVDGLENWNEGNRIVDVAGNQLAFMSENDGMANRKDVVGNQGGRSADDILTGAPFDAQAAYEKHGGEGDVDESTDITAKSNAFADMAESQGYKVAGRGDKYVTLTKSFGKTDDGYDKQAVIKARISDHSNVNRGRFFGDADINIAPDDGYPRDTFDSALAKLRAAYVNDNLDTIIPNESLAPTPDGAPEFSRTPQTETKAFKDWFGDSVVTESGKAGAVPLVVYHGTNRDFEEFGEAKRRHNDDGAGEAYHFTSRAETAGDYATSFGTDDDGARTIPAYLSMQRPKVVRYKERAGIPRTDFISDNLIKAKESGSHDGLIVFGLDEGNGIETHYIAFRPEQIKSAIGNRGTFGLRNADIRYSLAASRRRTPEWAKRPRDLDFEGWFRGSVVRTPLFHKTASRFDRFDTTRSDLGSHFGTLEQIVNLGERAGNAGPNVVPVWLSIKNPLRLADMGSFHADGIALQLERKGLLARGEGQRITQLCDENWRLRKEFDPVVRQAIIDAGYDGVVYRNQHEGGGDSYIAFDPEQIRFALAPGPRPSATPEFRQWIAGTKVVDHLRQPLMVFRGCAAGSDGILGMPSGGARDGLLWASSSRAQASFFEDGEIQNLYLKLTQPLVIREEDRRGRSHAVIVRHALAQVRAGLANWDGVIFPDTVDGMEVGDVFAVFPVAGGLDHAVRYVGRTVFDEQSGRPSYEGEQPAVDPERFVGRTWFDEQMAESPQEAALEQLRYSLSLPSPGFDGTPDRPHDLAADPRFHDFFFGRASSAQVRELAAWLRGRPNDFIRLYHGTAAANPVWEKGLLPTSTTRRNSYQSSNGFVCASVYPGLARDFGAMAATSRGRDADGYRIAVYPVVTTIRQLRADLDQLANQRSIGHDVGNSLAESLIYGHGARLRGRVDPMCLRSPIRYRELSGEGDQPEPQQHRTAERMRG